MAGTYSPEFCPSFVPLRVLLFFWNPFLTLSGLPKCPPLWPRRSPSFLGPCHVLCRNCLCTSPVSLQAYKFLAAGTEYIFCHFCMSGTYSGAWHVVCVQKPLFDCVNWESSTHSHDFNSAATVRLSWSKMIWGAQFMLMFGIRFGQLSNCAFKDCWDHVIPCFTSLWICRLYMETHLAERRRLSGLPICNRKLD